MEGWFGRITAPERGVVVVVLAGVNRDRAGRAWGTVGLAAHPGGFSRALAVDDAAVVDGAGAIPIGSALRPDPREGSGAGDPRGDPPVGVVLGAPGRLPPPPFGR